MSGHASNAGRGWPFMVGSAPMKREELLQHARCNLCGNRVGASGLPLFWKVTIERFGIDLRASERQDALGTFAIAAVMGPDDDLAKPLMDAAVITVCETCSTSRDLPVAALAEHRTKSEARDADRTS